MATKAKPAAKPAAKKAAPAPKKAVPAKKAAPVKKASTPAKPAAKAATKGAVKPVAKAAKPAVKTTPSKKAAVAPAKKAAPAPVKKTAAPVKKAVVAPAKKAAPIPVKKAEPPVKKQVAAKAEPKIVKAEKPVAAPQPVKEPRTPKAKKQAGPLKAGSTLANRLTSKPAPTPKPAPNAFLNRDEKKDLIVAHRKLERDNATQDDAGLTMVAYQPENVRSILDSNPEQHQGPIYRYSDEELNEFKTLIMRKLESSRKDLAYLQGLITRKDEAGTEDTENRYMNMEDGSGAMEREQIAQMASRTIQFINNLEKALIRIENKTYGICRVTGKLIDKARLRIVPHATLSIEAKNMMNKR